MSLNKCAIIIVLLLHLMHFVAFGKNKCYTYYTDSQVKNTRGGSCRNYKSTAMNSHYQAIITDVHNNLRNTVALGNEIRGKSGPQPSASNMLIMSWDKELADTAQLWVNQCVSGHDPCTYLDRFPMGQNIYYMTQSSSSSSFNFEEFLKNGVTAWYNEVKDVSREDYEHFGVGTSFSKIGHYTQVVWAETYLVGCGHASYVKNDGWIANTLICNYGPAGNWKNEPLYESGENCKYCKCSSIYRALCTNSPNKRMRQRGKRTVFNVTRHEKRHKRVADTNIFKGGLEKPHINKELTSKLFDLFQKLNLTLTNDLLLKLNSLQNEYNIKYYLGDLIKDDYDDNEDKNQDHIDTTVGYEDNHIKEFRNKFFFDETFKRVEILNRSELIKRFVSKSQPNCDCYYQYVSAAILRRGNYMHVICTILLLLYFI